MTKIKNLPLSPLPADQFKTQIAAWSGQDKSRVLLVQGATGSGKSTRVPRYLFEAGLDVVVTQPRRIAAVTLAERVASEMGENPGQTVGYATGGGDPASSLYDDGTGILFVTDGLALIHEILGKQDRACLVLDEVHEWRVEGEVLIAWAKRELGKDADFRVVLMSATMDAPALAAYFAPVSPVTSIEIPGRLFPIEECPMPGMSLDQACLEHAKKGRTVLAFEHGKAEIERAIVRIEAGARTEGLNVLCVPLHGQLTREEQRRAFAPAPKGQIKIVVATNVAQTSITIPDINAVVDGGMEKIGVSTNGIHGLQIVPISLASRTQRKGRAGRVQVGYYTDLCPVKAEFRPAHDRPAIEREHLASTILRLASAGFKVSDLHFFHEPPQSQIDAALRELRLFGFLDENEVLTRRGEDAIKIPLDPHLAAMVLAARQYGCVSEILDVAAILSVGGVADNRVTEKSGPYVWKAHTLDEKGSDVLAQVNLFRAAQKPGAKWRDMSLHIKNFQDARKVRQDLVHALRGHVRENQSPAKREDVVKAIVAGSLHRLYVRDSYGYFRNEADAHERTLTRETLVLDAKMGVGSPMDIPFQTKRTGAIMYRRILGMFTSVTPAMLADVAPHLCMTVKDLRPAYDPSSDMVLAETEIRYGSVVLSKVKEPYHGPDAAQIFAQYVARSRSEGVALRALAERIRDLNNRLGREEFQPLDVEAYVTTVLAGATRMANVSTSILALPTAQNARMDEVETLCPPIVCLPFLGQDLSVSYDQGVPTVRVPMYMALDTARNWPDHVFIPSGTEVLFKIEDYYHDPIGPGPLCEIKPKLVEREILIAIQNMAHEVLDPDTDDVPNSPVLVSIGESRITGQPFQVWRTVGLYYGRYRTEHFSDKATAEREHDAALSAMAQARKAKTEREQVDTLMTECSALYHQIRRLDGVWYYDSTVSTIEDANKILNEGKNALAKAQKAHDEARRPAISFNSSENLTGTMAAAFSRVGQKKNRR